MVVERERERRIMSTIDGDYIGFENYEETFIIYVKKAILIYFTTLRETYKNKKDRKKVLFPLDKNTRLSQQEWQWIIRVYRNHDIQYGGHKIGEKRAITRDDIIKRDIVDMSLDVLYRFACALRLTGAVLLFNCIADEIIRRLMPLPLERIYEIHKPLSSDVTQDYVERLLRSSTDPVHVINRPFYTKYVSLLLLFEIQTGSRDVATAIISRAPEPTVGSLIASRNSSSVMITENGLYECKLDVYGNIGVPSLIQLEYEVISVVSGAHHTLILTTNGVYAYGENDRGQLGITETGKINVWPPVRVELEGVIAISCGYDHSVFVTIDGELYGAGSNEFGQLGIGIEVPDLTKYPGALDCRQPTRIHCTEEIESVSCGQYHTMVLTRYGFVYSCGKNDRKQLGPLTRERAMEHDLSLLGFLSGDEYRANDTVTHLACGASHSALITRDGQLYTFGENERGQLGRGTRTFSEQKRRIRIAIDEDISIEVDGEEKEKKAVILVSSVSCGARHTMVLMSDRSLYTCGDNKGYGQLGIGETNESQNELIRVDIRNVIAVSCGDTHSLILTDNGLFVCGRGDDRGEMLSNRQRATIKKKHFLPRKIETLVMGHERMSPTLDISSSFFNKCLKK